MKRYIDKGYNCGSGDSAVSVEGKKKDTRYCFKEGG